MTLLEYLQSKMPPGYTVTKERDWYTCGCGLHVDYDDFDAHNSVCDGGTS